MFAYLRAPLLIWRITGACRSFAAQKMPWISSMLFTLNAPDREPALHRLLRTSSPY